MSLHRVALSLRLSVLLGFAIALERTAAAQQPPLSDPTFDPSVARPAYAARSGPRVAFDEAHYNYHTAGGRYTEIRLQDCRIVRAEVGFNSGDRRRLVGLRAFSQWTDCVGCLYAEVYCVSEGPGRGVHVEG